MAYVRINRILSITPLQISSGDFPELRYSTKKKKDRSELAKGKSFSEHRAVFLSNIKLVKILTFTENRFTFAPLKRDPFSRIQEY